MLADMVKQVLSKRPPPGKKPEGRRVDILPVLMTAYILNLIPARPQKE